MKKVYSLATMFVALSAAMLQAQDFQVLTTSEEVIANSVENQAGAKAQFQAVIENADATEAEKTEAMHVYMQQATPAPGYAFDMSYLIPYNDVDDSNKGKYTQATLAEYWKTDVAGLVFGSNSVFMVTSNEANGVYMRVNETSGLMNAEDAIGKFVLYQDVNLAKGAYHLQARAFVAGLANAVTLSAGDIAESSKVNGSPLKDYSVDFKVAEAGDIKLGFKRTTVSGKLTQVAFNQMYLYKTSTIVEITDESGQLNPAEGVDVVVKREFDADTYYPICLPFQIDNWRDVFADVTLWSNYDNGTLEFKSISGANTQARKPYLVKFNMVINQDNYLTFNNVNIQKGDAGSWVKSVAEGEEAYPVKMVGNWAEQALPEKCYYFDGNKWVLATASRSEGMLPSFSAYIDASGLDECPELMAMKVNDAIVTVIEVASSQAEPGVVNVYNLQGMAVKVGVNETEALEGLPHGLYIVNGKKIVK